MDTAQAIFEQAQQAIADNKPIDALPLFVSLLNRNINNPELLYCVSDCMIRMGWNGPAITLLGAALQIKPEFQEAWNNLGVAFRHENYNDLARASWEKAIAAKPTVEAISNMATLSADMGDPDDAIRWCDKAIEIDSTHWQSYWNKSLAELSKRNWGTGWDLYENRRKLSHFDSRPTIDAPQWGGQYIEHLYLHGEQGVGDEVMFCTIVPEVLPRVGKLTIEGHKKFAGLLRQSFPGVAVVSTEDEAAGTHFDAKCGMGTLATFFRRRREQFPGTPYLKPDPALVEHYRQELRKLGPAPYIGVTWIGGTKKTRVEDRSISLTDLLPILRKYTCVGAQYINLARDEIEAERKSVDLPKIDEASSGADMHAQAALFAACDAVVTVCQTAVHVAGAVGTPTYVMVPHKPSWRYGIEGDDLPWYNSVQLFRQGPRDQWLQVISRIEQALRQQFKEEQAA